MSDKKEGAIYQCDAGHWYVQSVGSGPGSWSLPFVGCPVCKLEGYATREANGMQQVAELEDELTAARNAALSEGVRSGELQSRLHSAELLLSETIEYLPIGGTAQIRARVQAHFLSAVVEIPAPISHVGCVLCDGSGWKDIMIGAETKRLPCSGPIPVPLE